MTRVVITAGGTKENIDPVRYIGNHSSGKMGFAIADEAYNQGFDVVMISTFRVDKPYPVIVAESSDKMFDAVSSEFPNADILIMAAAVADFKPKIVAQNKIKKTDKDTLIIELVKTKDILREISKIKRDNQIIIGFCAESENLLNNAQKKLEEKKLDFIVANDISRSDIGFGSEFNEITIISSIGMQIHIDKMKKTEIAKKILEMCIK